MLDEFDNNFEKRGCELNKILADHGSKFYNRSIALKFIKDTVKENLLLLRDLSEP